MDHSITLAVDVERRPLPASPRSSRPRPGQRGFWTADCEVSADRARFGFPQAPVDLHGGRRHRARQARQHAGHSGFPYWAGSTWESGELGRARPRREREPRCCSGTTASAPATPRSTSATPTQAFPRALILDRLQRYVATASPQPLLPAATSLVRRP